MKKTFIAICSLFTSVGAFAYYGGYEYSSHNDEMSGFAIFTLIVMIAYIVLSIIVLVRWFKMTDNVEKITKHLTLSKTQLTYLVAIGEAEKAKKDALAMIVDKLYPVYFDCNIFHKADYMNDYLEEMLPKIKRLGIELPDYVKSGEKFIDYMNSLTGGNITY